MSETSEEQLAFEADDIPAPAPKKRPTKKKAVASKTKIVKYVGRATVRKISKESWEAIGVFGQGDSVWDFLKSPGIPVTEFTEQALKYLTTNEYESSNFKVVEE